MSTGYELELNACALVHAIVDAGEKPLEHNPENREQLQRLANTLSCLLGEFDR